MKRSHDEQIDQSPKRAKLETPTLKMLELIPQGETPRLPLELIDIIMGSLGISARLINQKYSKQYEQLLIDKVQSTIFPIRRLPLICYDSLCGCIMPKHIRKIEGVYPKYSDQQKMFRTLYPNAKRVIHLRRIKFEIR